MELTLVVMAAGMGSRYGGLKQVDSFGPNGETLLEYSLFDALRTGFTRFVFIIRKDIEATFEQRVCARFKGKLNYQFAYQERDSLIPYGFKIPQERTKPWGTGHAVLCARELVETPFAVINADDFYGAPAYAAMAHLLSSIPHNDSPVFAVAGYKLKDTLSDNGTVSRAICQLGPERRLLSLREFTRIQRSPYGIVDETEQKNPTILTGNETVSLNMWGFTPALFPLLQTRFEQFLREKGNKDPKAEFYLPEAANSALVSGEAYGIVVPTGAQWFGVTHPEDKETVQQAINEQIAIGEYPEQLWKAPNE